MSKPHLVQTSEHTIENRLKTKLEKIGYMCSKWAGQSQNGVPDRIVIGYGNVYFVELKRPGGKPRAIQNAMHRKLKNHGADVRVISTPEEVDAFVQELADKKDAI